MGKGLDGRVAPGVAWSGLVCAACLPMVELKNECSLPLLALWPVSQIAIQSLNLF